MRAAVLVVLALLVAGCSGGDPEAGPSPSASSSPTSTPPSANVTSTPAPVPLAGSQLGRTADTPVIDLGPGAWSLTFDQQGLHQAILRLQADLDPQAYSITGSGRFTLAIFPLGTVLGECAASTVHAMASGGLVGLNNTLLDDLAAGDYFLVMHNEDMSTQFTWQVGDGDEERELDASGEASDWKSVDVTASVEGLSFTADLKPGLQFLLAQGSTTGPTQDSSLTHEVRAGAESCATGQDSAGLSPVASSLRVTATLLTGVATTWTGTYEATTVLPAASPTVSGLGRILVAPGN